MIKDGHVYGDEFESPVLSWAPHDPVEKVAQDHGIILTEAKTDHHKKETKDLQKDIKPHEKVSVVQRESESNLLFEQKIRQDHTNLLKNLTTNLCNSLNIYNNNVKEALYNTIILVYFSEIEPRLTEESLATLTNIVNNCSIYITDGLRNDDLSSDALNKDTKLDELLLQFFRTAINDINTKKQQANAANLAASNAQRRGGFIDKISRHIPALNRTRTSATTHASSSSSSSSSRSSITPAAGVTGSSSSSITPAAGVTGSSSSSITPAAGVVKSLAYANLGDDSAYNLYKSTHEINTFKYDSTTDHFFFTYPAPTEQNANRYCKYQLKRVLLGTTNIIDTIKTKISVPNLNHLQIHYNTKDNSFFLSYNDPNRDSDLNKQISKQLNKTLTDNIQGLHDNSRNISLEDEKQPQQNLYKRLLSCGASPNDNDGRDSRFVQHKELDYTIHGATLHLYNQEYISVERGRRWADKISETATKISSCFVR